MNKARHRAREVALQILYHYDMAFRSRGEAIPSGPMLAQDLDRHFAHFEVPEPVREFAAELVAGTLIEVQKIDERIERHSTHWRLNRLSYVDRNLLRMSVYEMERFEDIPSSVTLNEAIELGKQFGSAETPSFVNGVLDSIRKEIESAKVETSG